MTTFHALFDGQPPVVAHVCAEHREECLQIPCWDCDTIGTDCPHVQHVVCDCADAPDCDICADARVLA